MTDDKVCLITGGTNGIGLASAKELASSGVTVTILGRNPEKGLHCVEEIKQYAGHERVDFLLCDLSSQESIRKAAATYLDTQKPIDILLNNAGVMNLERRVTVDGFEETWAVNHLGYFLLTQLLLPRLKERPKTRIINVSSDAYSFIKGLQWDDLQFEHGYKSFKVYAHSKLANILFTFELARQLEDTDIIVQTLHPGGVRTGLGQHNHAPFLKILYKLIGPFLKKPENGAKTSVYLCTSPDIEGQEVGYWADCKRRELKSYAKDMDAAKRLWDISLQQTGLS